MLCSTATLSLRFQANGGTTSLYVPRQDPPWRAVRAFRNSSGEALVHLQNVSGGILGGDRLQLEVEVAPGAQAQIASTGATRIYRRGGRESASQCVAAHVCRGALLEYLPDVTIPFAGSSFEQSCEFHLEEDAGLIWWETLAAGRVGHGECFALERFTSSVAIHADGVPIFLERYTLDPKSQRLDSPARFGPFRYSASLYVCRPGRQTAEWLALENSLGEIADMLSSSEVRWGASALAAHGVVVRGLAREAYQIAKGLHAFWRKAKPDVWGRPAILPRKVQ